MTYKRIPLPNQGAGRNIVGPFKWADRPDAGDFRGELIFISDIGTQGSIWMSDGVRWRPMNGSVVLATSAVAVSCPADTTEDILATVTIPAGVMGLNGALRVTTFWTYTNSANNKSLRARFGGIGGTAYVVSVQTASAAAAIVAHVVNRGATNSQAGAQYGTNSIGGVIGSGPLTGAVDTAVDTTVVITGQKASAGETLTLESYIVELLTP